ncbi:MAG: FecR family protein [Candidatus Riflebacteria bacterium]|nr:FecR family protein [Candidatus Riflebacteria bacterium]
MNNSIQKTFLIIIMVFTALSAGAQARQGKYFFYPLIGRSVLSRTSGSTWLALQKSQPVEVKAGDLINVEGNGRGELHFPNGSVVRIKNNAMVTVLRYGISLRLGYAWLNIRRSTDTFYTVTPLGTCRVLGTSFDVDVDRFGKSHVRVFDGIVAVSANESATAKQLVLQAGMRTNVTDKTKVNDKPDKFNSQTIAAAIASEWEPRQFADEGMPEVAPYLKQEVEKYEAPAEPVSKTDDFKTAVRQRSEFQEMLMRRQLAKDSVIGGYTSAFGEPDKTGNDSLVSEKNQADREYTSLRNRLLRVQGEIMQSEMQIKGMIAENINTLTQRRKISEAQTNLRSLQLEHRVLQNRLRAIDNLKRR